jgi:hypothetical protein
MVIKNNDIRRRSDRIEVNRMKKCRLLSIITLGLGISIVVPAIAGSAEETAMDTQVQNQSQRPEAATKAQENKNLPASKSPSDEEKEALEWMDKTLEENAKENK